MKNLPIKPLKLSCLSLSLLPLSACVVFPLQQSDGEQQLNWCPPLPNCVSTEASTFMHRIAGFQLAMSTADAWPTIKQAVLELPRVSIQQERPGYIYAKSHSPTFKFVDYFEVLAVPKQQRLMVRSSALWGISDLGINKQRTEALRARLKTDGVIR